MNPEDHSVNDSFLENSMNTEDVFSLLTDDKILKHIVTKCRFSREEAEEVRVSLMAQEALEDMKDIEPQEQEFRERFLKEFPQIKWALEEQITQLRALADKADKIHKDCTISNVVATSSGIVSGILTITGIGLAPVTAGVSLGLVAAGLGLGTASAVTGVATGIVEHTRLAAIEGDAKKLTSTEVNLEEEIKGIVSNCALKLVPMAKIASPGARQVQKGIGGTALAMSKGTRVAGIVTSVIFLLVDVYNLVNQSIDLQKGAETASACRLREQASELEMKLENLKEIYANLLEDLVEA